MKCFRVIVLLLGLAIPSFANATYVYTTNEGGVWLGGGGPIIDRSQYFGVSFTITRPSSITGLGGSIIRDPSNSGRIFAAILPLTLNSPYPDSPTKVYESALAGVSFQAGASPDSYVPLSLTLAPGNYALVFGGGTAYGSPDAIEGPFGATGSAFAVGLVNASANMPSYMMSNGWAWQGAGYGNAIDCHGATNYGPSNCVKFSIYGSGTGVDYVAPINAVPLPGAFPLFAMLLGGLAYYSRRISVRSE